MLNGRFDSDDDGRVDRDLDGRNIAPDRLNAFVDALVSEGVSARLQVSHFFDRKFDGGLPENDFNGYTLIDLLDSYRSDRFGDFRFGIQNLFDKHYITYYSQTVTFVNDSTFVSGRGRALTVNWQFHF